MEITEKTVDIIRQCRELLRGITPLKSDCGSLCARRCCCGDDRTGMRLFPGEYELLENAPFLEFFDVEGNYGFRTAVCSGRCDRDLRPLSCMIFPFFPMTDPPDARADIRAASMCPILSDWREPRGDFIDAVIKCAGLMSEDPVLSGYVSKVNGELDELLRLYELLAEEDE